MIDWIDIVSPRLREVFQSWCFFRREKMLPEVGDYNAFSVVVPESNLISVVVPKARPDSYFRFVGSFGQRLAPKAEVKVKLEKIVPLPQRISIATPFYRTMRSGQPFARRAEYQRGDQKRPFEQLVLPFADLSGRICLVDSIYLDVGNDREDDT